MSRFSGPFPGTKLRNKGVLRKLRALRRTQAKQRRKEKYKRGSFVPQPFTSADL